jgi:hypothetical protein
MSIGYRSRYLGRSGLGVIFLLLGAATLVGAAPQTPREQTKMSRDEEYRRLFVILDSAEAALRQQPTNLAAQINYLRELETTLQGLRASSPEEPGPTKPTPASSEKVTGEAIAAAPGGPVKPSARPSREADEQRRRHATEKLRGGGPLARPYEAKTLRGIPEDSVLRACSLVEGRSRDLRERLARGGVERQRIVSGLLDLRAAVEKMGRPEGQTK